MIKVSSFLLFGLVLLLAFAGACSPAASTTTGTTSPATTPPTSNTSTPATSTSVTTTTTTGQHVVITLAAQNMAFDTKTIVVSAGGTVTVNFDNKDNAPHNLAVYTDSSAKTTLFKGQVVTRTSIVYTFTAPATPGTYFFRCDVHPASMTGSFIVE
jgi:plastocyanin